MGSNLKSTYLDIMKHTWSCLKMGRPNPNIQNPRLFHAYQVSRSTCSNWQELATARALDKSRLSYTRQQPFLVHDRVFILDFLAQSPRGIPVVIECSTSRGSPARLRGKAERLDYRFRLLKELLCIATVSLLTPTESYEIPRFLSELRRSLAFTDVVIPRPEDAHQAVIIAGERVFEKLSNEDSSFCNQNMQDSISGS